MPAPTNSDIMRVLGRLEEGQEHAKEGRKVIHEKLDRVDVKLDGLADTVQRQAYDLAITSSTATQARDIALKLQADLEQEVKPRLDAVATFRAAAEPIINNIKTLRNGIFILVTLLGAFGILSAGTLFFANDVAKAIVRSWLEIPDPRNR